MIIAVLLFIVGYAFIALETPLKVDKSATALLLGTAIWVFYIFAGEDVFAYTNFTANYAQYKALNPGGSFFDFVSHYELVQHIGSIAEILFFLLGAMTIVETIDHHNGFSLITNKITTTNKRKLLWILTTITFFLSGMLDNLTTTIVMCVLLRKLISKRKERWLFACMIVFAANCGGAWSPIGDVTTIMLWMGEQVSATHLIFKAFIPCMVSVLVPLTILSFSLKGNVERPINNTMEASHEAPARIKIRVFLVGIGGLLFVPVFKTITHLPPFVGMLFSLAVLWFVTARLHYWYSEKTFSCAKVLERIDTSSILFFLGILLAVAGLQSMGYLSMLATGLTQTFDNNIYSMNICIGMLSSIIDNVPLVAGIIGMYPLDVFPTDHSFWIFLSCCAGIGGNMLIISSAAGIAAMGMEKIDFMWYLKKITLLAVIGFFTGAGMFVLLDKFVY